MLQSIDYTPDEWATSTGRPLAARAGEELLLLHRHWMWANVQRLEFDKLLGTEELGEPRTDDDGFTEHGLHVRLVRSALVDCRRPARPQD
jgi:hypothetical protein